MGNLNTIQGKGGGVAGRDGGGGGGNFGPRKRRGFEPSVNQKQLKPRTTNEGGRALQWQREEGSGKKGVKKRGTFAGTKHTPISRELVPGGTGEAKEGWEGGGLFWKITNALRSKTLGGLRGRGGGGGDQKESGCHKNRKCWGGNDLPLASSWGMKKGEPGNRGG